MGSKGTTRAGAMHLLLTLESALNMGMGWSIPVLTPVHHLACSMLNCDWTQGKAAHHLFFTEVGEWIPSRLVLPHLMQLPLSGKGRKELWSGHCCGLAINA